MTNVEGADREDVELVLVRIELEEAEEVEIEEVAELETEGLEEDKVEELEEGTDEEEELVEELEEEVVVEEVEELEVARYTPAAPAITIIITITAIPIFRDIPPL